MLAAFQEATQRPDSVVVLLDEDIMMASPAAQRALESTDHLQLRDLAREAVVEPHVRAARLTDGTDVRIRFRRLADAPSGVLFEIAADGRRRPVPRRRAPSRPKDPLAVLDAHRARRTNVLVTGEPGSGRSAAVARLAGCDPVCSHDAADVALMGEARWDEALTDVAREHTGLLAVENIHLLPPTTAARTARALRDASVWFAFTSGPPADLGAEQVGLAALCGARVEIQPLRFRKDELPDLVGALFAELAPGLPVRLTRGAWDALRNHPWPGNLHELRQVLAHVAEQITGEVVTAEDLPLRLREHRPGRRLTMLEQAERDAIVRALQQHGGNKVHAAEALGISRTTLYKRIRLLDIES
jgi:hypothetical protein